MELIYTAAASGWADIEDEMRCGIHSYLISTTKKAWFHRSYRLSDTDLYEEPMQNVNKMTVYNLMVSKQKFVENSQLSLFEKRLCLFHVCLTVHHWYNNINSLLDAKITNFIDNYNQLNMFQAIIRPSSGALDCVYSLWYNAPTMLPAGSCKKKTQSTAPEDGRNFRPKHVELIEVINKLTLPLSVLIATKAKASRRIHMGGWTRCLPPLLLMPRLRANEMHLFGTCPRPMGRIRFKE